MYTKAASEVDRPGDHRHDGGARLLHAAALRLAVLDVVPLGRGCLQDAAELHSRQVSISATTWRWYARAFRSLQIYFNSVEIAVVVTVSQLVTCTLAAFAFARLKFRGREALFFILLVGLMFPAQVTILPIYLGYAKLGLHQPADRAGAHVPDLELRRVPHAPVHAEPAEGAGGGGADGRRRLLQDLLAHLAAATQAGAVGARHHHLHPDLELLLPGQGAAWAAGRR